VRHTDWLRLIDVSGPFIGLGVLAETFPLGLDADEPEATARLRQAYAEWEADRRRRHPDRAVHRAWAMLVLRDFLEYRDGSLREGPAIPDAVKAYLPEQRVLLRPDFALAHANEAPVLLVNVLPPGTRLERPQDDGGLHASPAERMRLLLRGAQVRSGLLTNGDQWMLVHQPQDRTATFVTWESEVLVEEPEARRALRSLLGVRRLLGVADADTLDGLFERSRDDEREVTDQLGAQTRRAVELLIAAIDRADRETGGKLLAEESLEHVYEAAVVVAMRAIFMLAAEARGLMPEEEAWLESYAITPLREQLQAAADRHGPELLDRRFDAWPRLLAGFRAVHGGVTHERIRLPGYGGGLFNPRRYVFLEGAADVPLRISNRVMLYVLDALQTLEVDVPGGRERRPLSFRALGVEQIGHVYEGLLDHEAVRTTEPVLGLVGTSKKEPEIALPELERTRSAGNEELLAFLREQTGRSESALRRALESEPDPARLARLRAACDNGERLIASVLPFLALVRDDSFGFPTVFLPDALYVTVSARRRATGTHYTPPSLTEPIVRYALEPLVYRGPSDGRDREQWELKPASELLALKVCDIAMGSGAFLVAACRYLAERLVEAWSAHPADAPEGVGGNTDERELTALRLVAERCVYGVDKNPLAVEIAKVSLWLITLRKDRPFTFVDHALRCGDSLIGLTSEYQLCNLSLRPEEAPAGWMLDLPRQRVGEVLTRARELRERIESSDAVDLREVQEKLALLAEAAHVTRSLRAVADLVAGAALAAASSDDTDTSRILVEEHATEILTALDDEHMLDIEIALANISKDANRHLHTARDKIRSVVRPFHWITDLPEVFTGQGGFDAIISNPPFLGGVALADTFGERYAVLLKDLLPDSHGFVDLAAYFHRRAHLLINPQGVVALFGPQNLVNTANRKASTEGLLNSGRQISWANRKILWPGTASLYICTIVYSPASFSLRPVLDGRLVSNISASLDTESDVSQAARLRQWVNYSQGTDLYGASFVKPSGDWDQYVRKEPALAMYLRPYVNADILCSTPSSRSDLLAVDFGDREKDELQAVSSVVAHLEEQVGHERARQTRQIHEARAWLHWDKRLKAYETARKDELVLVCPRVSKHLPMLMVDSSFLLGKSVKFFPAADYDIYALLQTTIFLVWAFATSPLRGDGIEFSTRNSLDTFPPPEQAGSELKPVGQELWERRKAFMHTHDIGITELLNRLHDQNIGDADVVAMRNCQRNLDRVAVSRYSWSDIDLTHDFWDTHQGVRFTFGPEARSELMKRLLSLNHKRYAEEVAQGLHAGKRKTARKRRPRAPKAAVGAERLFGDE
jgi:hypothetical protein